MSIISSITKIGKGFLPEIIGNGAKTASKSGNKSLLMRNSLWQSVPKTNINNLRYAAPEIKLSDLKFPKEVERQIAQLKPSQSTLADLKYMNNDMRNEFLSHDAQTRQVLIESFEQSAKTGPSSSVASEAIAKAESNLQSQVKSQGSNLLGRTLPKNTILSENEVNRIIHSQNFPFEENELQRVLDSWKADIDQLATRIENGEMKLGPLVTEKEYVSEFNRLNRTYHTMSNVVGAKAAISDEANEILINRIFPAMQYHQNKFLKYDNIFPDMFKTTDIATHRRGQLFAAVEEFDAGKASQNLNSLDDVTKFIENLEKAKIGNKISEQDYNSYNQFANDMITLFQSNSAHIV